MGGTASHGHSREEGEGNRKEGIQLREGTCIRTNPSHWGLQGGAVCWVQHILRDRAWKQWESLLDAVNNSSMSWLLARAIDGSLHILLLFPILNAPCQACTTPKYQDPMVLHPSASSRLAMDLCCYLYLRRPGSSCWQPLISAVRNWQRRGKCTLQRQPGTFNLHQLEQWLLNTGNCFIHGVGLRQLLSNWPGALCPSSRVFCTHSRLDSPGQAVLSVQLLEHWQCPGPSLSASITAMRQPAPASEVHSSDAFPVPGWLSPMWRRIALFTRPLAQPRTVFIRKH